MRILVFAATAALAAPVAFAQPAPAPADLTLHLVCQGDLIVAEQDTTMVNDGSRRSSGLVTTQHMGRTAARVELDVKGGAVRIHPASGMLPFFARKSPDGWYDMTEVVIDPDKIAGRYSLGALSKPTVKVDRRTGDIEVRGLAGDFDGYCEKSDTPVGAQKF